MVYFGDVEEVGFGGGLIPEGTVTMCAVTFDKDKRTSQNGNGYYNATFESLDPNYSGSKFFENVGVDGSEGYFLQKGKTTIRYILETTRSAHKDPMQYNVATMQELNGSKVVVQVGIKVHTKEDGTKILVNYAKAFGTPRESSRNYKFYEAWDKKEQPWQTDERPVITNGAKPTSNLHPYDPAYSSGEVRL